MHLFVLSKEFVLLSRNSEREKHSSKKTTLTTGENTKEKKKEDTGPNCECARKGIKETERQREIEREGKVNETP
jgi:hypothetical protein